MLKSLYISNIVLISRAQLDFDSGLVVLTGETGAGKSMVLDALALALGARSDAGLVRHGCESATVVAEFDHGTEIENLLSEHGIDADDTLTLKRVLSADGKSRAWINDVPVSLKILKSVGDLCAEIHGQFENHSLLDSATHITALDEFGQYDLSPVRAAYAVMRAAD
ncbi:MAG: AAA family ATPase, partial [Rickettsiales bacterium]|nr:AAA family ATPase [Rickettsiales bacterium]